MSVNCTRPRCSDPKRLLSPWPQKLTVHEKSVVRRGLNSGRVGVFDFLALRHRTLSSSESPNFFTSQELVVARLLITQNEWPKDIGARQARDRLCGKSNANSTMAPPSAASGDRCSELYLSANRVSMTPHHTTHPGIEISRL